MAKLSVYRGDDFSRQLIFTDGDGVAINITDWVIFFTVKKNENDADVDAIITKDVSVHSNPAGGISAIILTDTDTEVSPRIYWYDIQVKTDTGAIRTITKDKFEVHTDITRRIV